MRLAVAVCLVALAVGLAAGLLVNVRTSPVPIDPSLTGGATDGTTGATLAVTVSGRGDRSTVTATVTGLRPAIGYQLLAVTIDGRTLLVCQWLGADGPQVVAGDIHAAAPQIAHVMVATKDGEVIVTLRFRQAGTSVASPMEPS
jgi:hypothetical protein